MLNVMVTWLYFTRRAKKYDLNHFQHQKQHLIFVFTFCLCHMQYLHHLDLGIHMNAEQYSLLACLFLMIAVSPTRCQVFVFFLLLLFFCSMLSLYFSDLHFTHASTTPSSLSLSRLTPASFYPWGKRCTVPFSAVLSSMTDGGY